MRFHRFDSPKVAKTYLCQPLPNTLQTLPKLDKGEYKLSDAQKNRILEAESDKVLTDEEANREIEEWLNER